MKNLDQYIDVETKEQDIVGPMGEHSIRLLLDGSQIYMDEPGEGTPVLIEVGKETMTWNCGYEGGNHVELGTTKEQAQWLDDISNDVQAWMDYWTGWAENNHNNARKYCD